nr:hypothetical protein TQ38_24685 [Novosphingobium sp. P6W]
MHPSISIYATPILFGLAAGISRWLVQSGTETRYQILAFWILAAILEMNAAEVASNLCRKRLLLSLAAVAVSTIVVKVVIEGPINSLQQMFGGTVEDYRWAKM